MNKIKIDRFPIIATAEDKTSQSGNPYTSFGIGLKAKDKNGETKTTWLNFIDKRDLLVLASACKDLYSMTCEEKQAEHEQKAPTQTFEEPAQDFTPDEIPF